jgi:hypothetical protein
MYLIENKTHFLTLSSCRSNYIEYYLLVFVAAQSAISYRRFWNGVLHAACLHYSSTAKMEAAHTAKIWEVIYKHILIRSNVIFTPRNPGKDQLAKFVLDFQGNV